MIYDNRQHTRKKRVSVRSRLVAGAVKKIGDSISEGTSFDVAFGNAVQNMWLFAGTLGMGAMKVNRMANRVAAQVS